MLDGALAYSIVLHLEGGIFVFCLRGDLNIMISAIFVGPAFLWNLELGLFEV